MAKIETELDYDCLRVYTPCVVDANDYERTSDERTEVLCDKAVWDTGASVTVISERMVERLGLIPVGKTKISGYNGRPVVTNEYRVDLKFSDDVTVNFVNVAEAPLVMMDMLIGMNVINKGDFHLDFRNGKQSFSFEVG